MSREFTKVGVIGLGTMGAGIVEVFARNGVEVVAVEVDDAAVARGRGILEHSTARAVSRGKLTPEDRTALLGRVRLSSGLDGLAALADCQLVVEAVPEDLELKKQIFARVDRIVTEDAILATNTSSLSVTEIAVATSNPKRVVGMHFFNPAPVLQLVEVIRTVGTQDSVFEDVRLSRSGWASDRSSSPTRPGSSPTRCSSDTSTTRCRCTRRAMRPARTSTPQCDSAAGCRWGRSR